MLIFLSIVSNVNIFLNVCKLRFKLIDFVVFPIYSSEGC